MEDEIRKAMHQIEELVAKAYEDEGTDELPWDHEIVMTLRTADDLVKMLDKLLRTNVIREPLEDVVFFAGSPKLDSLVYHVLCRKATFEQMKHDPNVHFMLMKQFNGTFDPDVARTFDEQETITRSRLEGSC